MKQKFCSILFTLLVLFASSALSSFSWTSPAFAKAIKKTKMTTLWLQATDSCKQGLPGASFSLISPSGKVLTAPQTQGMKRVSIPNASANCPTSQGSCILISTGCTSWTISLPRSGSVTYTIVENTKKATANGLTFQENPTGPGGSPLLGFVACTGGAACHSQSATVTVFSTGRIRAITTNVAPDTSVHIYGPFAGTQSDPVLFHNYQVGSDYTSVPCVASAGNVPMNYGTGTQGSHCKYISLPKGK